MLIKKILYVSLTIFLVASWMSSVAFAIDWYQQPPQTLSELDKACKKHMSKDGFGEVTLSNANFQNQTGKLTVPCALHIKPGSTFQMSNVHLETKNFVIESDDSDHPEHDQPTHIILRNVNLNGQESGLRITTNAPASTIVIKNSSIDYPSVIGFGVGADDNDAQSSIEVTNSTMRSMAQDSEGIWLVSTGKAVFKDNKFELNDPTDVAALLGAVCTIEHNIRANERCHNF